MMIKQRIKTEVESVEMINHRIKTEVESVEMMNLRIKIGRDHCPNDTRQHGQKTTVKVRSAHSP